MIFHFVNSFLIGMLFVDMLERRFPRQCINVLSEFTFNALYLYSKMQIRFVKLNMKFHTLVESTPILLSIKNALRNLMKSTTYIVTETQFIKDGEITKLENGEHCDFVLFSWLDGDTKCSNKKIIYDKNDPLTASERSDIKFMLVELQIGGNRTYKIDLKTDEYNYYVVGNKFTKPFFLFYLKCHLNNNIEINDADMMTLHIIDHEVNTFTVVFTDKNEYIALDKSSYTKSITNE